LAQIEELQALAGCSAVSGLAAIAALLAVVSPTYGEISAIKLQFNQAIWW